MQIAQQSLQMNPHKTELIWFGSCTNLQNVAALSSTLSQTHDVVQGVNAIHDPGVTLDSELSMQNDITSTKSLKPASITTDN